MELDYQALYEENNKLKSINEQQQIEIQALKLQLAQIRKMIYGSRQEKFVPQATVDQLSLDLPSESSGPVATSVQKISYERTTSKPTPTNGNHPGRYKLPEHLERKVILIEPEGVSETMKKIGEEITEELELEPGKLYVNRYVRPKYIDTRSERITIAPMVDRPLPKAIVGAGLLAQMMIDKYVDHLPIYRICERFKREKVNLPYNTMVDWIGQGIRLIEPLYGALKKKILSSDYLHADETGIKVMDKDRKGSTHQGWFWAYQNSIEGLILFDYHPTRSRGAPREILKDFKGHLQTDGYGVYDLYKEHDEITLMHCMAHARRMFFEAQYNDEPRSREALEHFHQLYTLERQIRDQQWGLAQIRAHRQEKAVPILEQFHSWMQKNILEVLPKSPIGKAIAYTLSRWKELTIYVTDGKLNIDNNPVENSIRPIAIGRKNYMFAGSHEAASRSAMLYSLLGTCKLQGINPQEWLKSTLVALPSHPINRVDELLPLAK